MQPILRQYKLHPAHWHVHDLDLHMAGLTGVSGLSNGCLHTCAGGTRFIGLYLARQLVEQGHDVTLFTRGKKPVDAMIPDDTRESHAQFRSRISHIAGDRMVSSSVFVVEVVWSHPLWATS
jgi:hypothetical protein